MAELKTQVSDQKKRIATLKERINAATGELEKALQWSGRGIASARRLSEGARQALASAARQLGSAEKLRPVTEIDPNNLETYAAKIHSG